MYFEFFFLHFILYPCTVLQKKIIFFFEYFYQLKWRFRAYAYLSHQWYKGFLRMKIAIFQKNDHFFKSAKKTA